ncbi:Mss4-like protein [Mycena sanguinolenta]|nr:Mss4-like protein [Mycena sanguinolenta]
MSAAPTDKSIPYIPLASGADDGWSNEDEATAACFCGAVQLKFPTYGPGYAGAFLCHCVDCRKITASMFASNFVVLDTHLTHLRGRYNLTAFAQSRDRNYFSSTCGTLMYRVSSGSPGKSILRVGTIDDFHLHETKLKPEVEQFTERVLDTFELYLL